MPWTPKPCPFCHKQYLNKTLLKNHLLKYIGSLRLPADGIDDVLEIKKLCDQENEEGEIGAYQCPYCADVISDEDNLAEHLRRKHGQSSMSLACHNVCQPSGPFPFLKLPLELREMIYKTALTFQEIRICDFSRTDIKPTSQWIRLQHNPPRNLLSLLAVSRQVYHEARRIFYRHNTFIFENRQSIPGFLLGIGRQNALLLKSVQWVNCDHFRDFATCGYCEPENNLNAINPYIAHEEANIWNDLDQFMGLLQVSMSFVGVFHNITHRLLRLNDDNVSAGDGYRRYKLYIQCHEHGDIWRDFEAAYVLRTRSVEDHPVRLAAFEKLFASKLADLL